MSGATEQVVTVAVAIVGVAILAVIVSKQSNTAQVISAAGSAFSGGLATALGPITGYKPGVGMAVNNY